MARRRQFDYTRGSLRSGCIAVVGTRVVLVAEKHLESGWWIGEQTRKEYEDSYLAMAHTTYASTGYVRRTIEFLYGPDALDPRHRIGEALRCRIGKA